MHTQRKKIHMWLSVCLFFLCILATIFVSAKFYFKKLRSGGPHYLAQLPKTYMGCPAGQKTPPGPKGSWPTPRHSLAHPINLPDSNNVVALSLSCVKISFDLFSCQILLTAPRQPSGFFFFVWFLQPFCATWKLVLRCWFLSIPNLSAFCNLTDD